MCPFCAEIFEDVSELRGHIEVRHMQEIRKFGAQGVNCMIFQRAKSGIRKISARQVRGILSTIPRKQRKQHLVLLKRILSLCLVQIGNDTD